MISSRDSLRAWMAHADLLLANLLDVRGEDKGYPQDDDGYPQDVHSERGEK